MTKPIPSVIINILHKHTERCNMFKAVLTVVIAFSLSACGTVAGIGQDIKDSATWTKDKMSGR